MSAQLTVQRGPGEFPGWVSASWPAVAKARLAGGHSGGVAPWHGSCAEPVLLRLEHRPDPSLRLLADVPYSTVPTFARAHVRCRKCEECLKWRQRLWTARAINEAEQAPGRTWFLTITTNWGGADSTPEIESKRLANLSKEITKAFKRLRQGTEVYRRGKLFKLPPVKFRYLLSFEHGEVGGRSHAHALVHEVSPMRWLHFHAAFRRLGIFEATLLRSVRGAAHYCAKYVTKAQVTRVRASLGYGQGSEMDQTHRETACAEQANSHSHPTLGDVGTSPHQSLVSFSPVQPEGVQSRGAGVSDPEEPSSNVKPLRLSRRRYGAASQASERQLAEASEAGQRQWTKGLPASSRSPCVLPGDQGNPEDRSMVPRLRRRAGNLRCAASDAACSERSGAPPRRRLD